jgi:hypothetical protein
MVLVLLANGNLVEAVLENALYGDVFQARMPHLDLIIVLFVDNQRKL